MAADDASSAEMRRLHHDYDAGPLALDEDTVERLLTGTLPPAQAPAGYGRVAQLLAAARAAPTPEELAGQGAVLAELRAAARARSTAPMGQRRPPRRRRRTGLAVVVVVGALVTGGVAGAATGHLPGPVRDAARSITGAPAGRASSSSTTSGQPPAPSPRIAGASPEGSRPGGAVGPGSGPVGNGTGPAVDPALKGLCEAYAAGNGAEQGGKLDATAFAALATAAGGEDKVAAFCEDLLPGDQKLEEPKGTKQPKQPEDPDPSGTGGQGQQGSPPSSTGGGQGISDPPSETGRAP